MKKIFLSQFRSKLLNILENASERPVSLKRAVSKNVDLINKIIAGGIETQGSLYLRLGGEEELGLNINSFLAYVAQAKRAQCRMPKK